MEQHDETVNEATDAAVAPEAPSSSPSGATAAPEASSGGAAAAGRGGGAQEVIAPKERRARARAQTAEKVGARPQRTPEERQAERDAQRRQKAAARSLRRRQERDKARTAGSSGQPTPPREHQPGSQKTRQGVVTSDKADKTITVRIDEARRHRRYSKIVRTSTTLHVHDERNDAHTGDTVVVREARPLSRTKRWRLVEVVERAK